MPSRFGGRYAVVLAPFPLLVAVQPTKHERSFPLSCKNQVYCRLNATNKACRMHNYKQLSVSVTADVTMGENVTIVHPCNIYGCKIGSNCFIGPFTEIQKTAIIGDNCKIQSHSFICELVTIGNNCFIGHGVMFINDVFTGGGPARGNKDLWKSTSVGNNVSIGSNSTILPVTVCDNTVIGAGSVVTKNITVPGVYAGNPAKLIRPL